MARRTATASTSTQDLVISGLGQLSHDTIGKGLVAFIVMLCVWTFIVHWWLVFPVTWEASAPASAVVTAFHHVLHGLLLYSLYRSVSEDPGFVARHAGGGQGAAGQADFCEKCAHRRPDRAHHCKVCKRCIKRMDHHCLFVNNCVGSHNYKFFVLLLLYTVVGGFYNGAISYAWVQISPSDNVLDFSRGMVVANGCTIAVISVVLFPFVCVHFYLASTNTTTLEALKGRTREYDLGSAMRNLKHVFGSRPWLWLSPFHSDIADQEPLLDL